MAATNPSGQMVYGDKGFPFSGILLGTNDGGQMVFGDGGFPFVYLFPAGAPPATNIGTFNGLAYASFSQVNGLAKSSIGTINGLT